LKEVFLTLTLGWRPLKIWLFIAYITNEFILELDILHACDTSMDLGHQMLRLVEEGLSLWSPGAGTRSSNLALAVDQVILAQYEEW
jgi:hypothetical protein